MPLDLVGIQADPALQAPEVHEEPSHDHPLIIDLMDLHDLAVGRIAARTSSRSLDTVLELPRATDLVDHHHDPTVVQSVVGLDHPLRDLLDELVAGLELLALHEAEYPVKGRRGRWRTFPIHPMMGADANVP